MNTLTSSPASVLRSWMLLVLAALLALLVGCTPASPPTTPSTAHAADLPPDAIDACRQVFARTHADAEVRLVLIVDRTASVGVAPLPTGLVDDLVDASERDGALTVIAVDGPGAPPRIVAKDVALSTAGDRSRPSVGQLAAVIPDCVRAVLLPDASPTAEGTDLHAPFAVASEMVDASTTLWALTDLISTGGPFTLDERMLRLDPADAAGRIGTAAPVDLGGAPLRLSGVGNASVALRTADREWLGAFARELCATWNATGCAEIATDPIEPVAAASLPADALPAFPSIAHAGDEATCTFVVPASIAFDGDSAELRPDAAAVLAEPLARAVDADLVRIVGHTASSPAYTADELIALGQARADAVAGLAVAAGVPAERVQASSVGDTQPLGEDIDPATGAQIAERAAAERRVEVTIEGAACSD